METFQLKDPTITMLTATNEAMSEDFFSRSAIQGGYFARTFIIYEKEGQNVNSLIYPLHNPPNYTISSDYLKEVAKLNGPFLPLASMERTDEFKYCKLIRGREVWFNESGTIYDDWYQSFKQMMKDQETKDETGTLNRFGDSVLKVAMLLSLCEAPQLILTPSAMLMAIDECEKLVGNVRKTTFGKHGISDSSLLKSLIIFELLGRENHKVTRTVLLKKMWMHYSGAEEFDELMQSFEASGMISTNSIGNQIIYSMNEHQAREMHKFVEGKGLI
jgi:hypothetical protein